MTLTLLFVYCFLFVNYYSKILLQLCQLYSTGHFIAELMVKIRRFTDHTTMAMSHNKQLLTLLGKEFFLNNQFVKVSMLNSNISPTRES